MFKEFPPSQKVGSFGIDNYDRRCMDRYGDPMKQTLALALAAMAISAASCSTDHKGGGSTASPGATDGLDRTVLPIHEPKVASDHRARRAQREGAAALRGDSAARARPTW